MLAFLGLLTSPLFHLPDAVFESRGGIDAVTKLYNERPEALWQIILALGAIETFTLFKNGQGQAGDLGFDPLNFKAKYENDPNMQLKELKNGRLAMLGTSAILIQEALSGKGVYDQL